MKFFDLEKQFFAHLRELQYYTSEIPDLSTLTNQLDLFIRLQESGKWAKQTEICAKERLYLLKKMLEATDFIKYKETVTLLPQVIDEFCSKLNQYDAMYSRADDMPWYTDSIINAKRRSLYKQTLIDEFSKSELVFQNFKMLREFKGLHPSQWHQLFVFTKKLLNDSASLYLFNAIQTDSKGINKISISAALMPDNGDLTYPMNLVPKKVFLSYNYEDDKDVSKCLRLALEQIHQNLFHFIESTEKKLLQPIPVYQREPFPETEKLLFQYFTKLLNALNDELQSFWIDAINRRLKLWQSGVWTWLPNRYKRASIYLFHSIMSFNHFDCNQLEQIEDCKYFLMNLYELLMQYDALSAPPAKMWQDSTYESFSFQIMDKIEDIEQAYFDDKGYKFVRAQHTNSHRIQIPEQLPSRENYFSYILELRVIDYEMQEIEIYASAALLPRCSKYKLFVEALNPKLLYKGKYIHNKVESSIVDLIEDLRNKAINVSKSKPNMLNKPIPLLHDTENAPEDYEKAIAFLIETAPDYLW